MVIISGHAPGSTGTFHSLNAIGAILLAKLIIDNEPKYVSR